MPIEIKELHIRIHVDDSNGNNAANATSSKNDSEKIVAACVEQVMDRLKLQQER